MTELQSSLSHWQQPCPNCGERSQAQDWRQRTVKPVCGSISFDRPRFVCDHCQHNSRAFDATLELEPRACLSEGLSEWLIGLGATTIFVEAAGWLERLAGLKVSAETVRQKTERRGDEFEETQQFASEQVSKRQEPVASLDPAPGVLVR